MDRLLTNFIRALRNADVRISTAETLDALGAVELVGYRDRQLLKNSLALVLPKTADEKATFDTVFDQFFASRAHHAPPTAEAEPESPTSEAAPSSAETEMASTTGTAGQSASSGAGAENAATSSPQSQLGQMLAHANQLEIGAEINSAGQRVNVHRIEVFTQKGVYTTRIMDAMGQAQLQQEISRLASSPNTADRRLARNLTQRREWLRERVREYVEHQFLLHADVTGRRLREDLLRTVRLSALEQRHHRLMQDIVLRMARRLVSQHSRRRKVFRRGQLHVPRTLRDNMKYDDAIFDLRWKATKVDRPRVLAICDVSGSVANYARFMLTFLYSLDEVLPKVRSFAFSAGLGEVSTLFAQHRIDDAIALALRQYGGGATDYGHAFATFRELCLHEIDRRSTIIMLGDARNNNGNARTDVLKELYERSKRVIWLNPESRAMWNTGDSEMRHYAPYCHQVEECGTLAQLERFVAKLLRSAA